MLQLDIPGTELFDETTNTFITFPGKTIQLEHSLVSISKWEARWKKPFLAKEPMTKEQSMDYIKCMTITPNVDPKLYDYIPTRLIKEVDQYVSDSMTATWFNEDGKGKKSNEVVTSEIIYYWMVSLNIPFECQKWHLNRLLTLIRVCNIKNQPPKKMSKKDILSRNKALNEARKAQFNSKG